MEWPNNGSQEEKRILRADMTLSALEKARVDSQSAEQKTTSGSGSASAGDSKGSSAGGSGAAGSAGSAAATETKAAASKDEETSKSSSSASGSGLFTQPVLSTLAKCKRILISGCGGGYDLFSG